MQTKIFRNGVVALLFVLFSQGASAYTYGTFIYASGVEMISNAHSIAGPSEGIVGLEINSVISSIYNWVWGYNNCICIEMILNVPILRVTSPDWYWAESIHFFLEEDQNVFDEDSFFMIYW